MSNARTAESTELMLRFADRTGLTSSRHARRYLWTDAFAVCAFLGLSRATGDEQFSELALRLVDQVHHELGRYRSDDRLRSGWLSGLNDLEAEAHPTRGGLRIGKALPERAATEPFDPELEWDRDGQYFHYLTKWMHALDQAARWTGEPRLNVWARELAEVAHRAFTFGAPGKKRMTWKLSIDLSRPLVPSMGQHDALDGFVTCAQLGATAASLAPASGPNLVVATADYVGMIDRGGLATTDPLGLGGLLVDAGWLAQLDAGNELSTSLLAAAAVGLRRYVAEPGLRGPAERRLAFRELGLTIGLAAVSMLRGNDLARRFDTFGQATLADLADYLPLRTEIESFWRQAAHRQTTTWGEHADINDVMLSTTLAPEGFLELEASRARTKESAA